MVELVCGLLFGSMLTAIPCQLSLPMCLL